MSINEISISSEEIEQKNYIIKVYNWMGLALVVTAGVAYYTIGNESMLRFIYGSKLVFFGLIIGELVLVGYLAAMVLRISANSAMLVFLGYAALNGITMSSIFLMYTRSSIASTFVITACTFGVMSGYGYFTKKDLTSWGSFFMMGLFGLIIASLVNMFLRNPIFYWVISFVGVFVFIGLTAYDTQKIKNLNIIGNEGTEEDKKEAIMGALVLYLDFINLFIMLLRLTGRRRR